MMEHSPIQGSLGGDFDKSRLPKFDSIKEFNLHSSSGVEYQLFLPDRENINYDSAQYSELRKRGHRFTKEGRTLAEYNWQVLCVASGTNPQMDINGETDMPPLAHASIEKIKENSKKVIEILEKDNETQSDYVNLMKRSFEARIRHMENVKFWQEMSASNSPFNQTIDVISDKVYHGMHKNFVKSFSTKAMFTLKERVNDHIETFVENGDVTEEQKEITRIAYENRIANHIESYLESSSPSKLQSLRESGISNLVDNVLDENRFTLSDEENGNPLMGYMNKTLEGVLQDIDEGNIITITEDDLITLESHRTKVKPDPEPSVREKLSSFRKKVGDHFKNMPAANKVRIIAANLFGAALVTVAAANEHLQNPDINQELSAPKDPAKTWVSPEIDYALNLPEKPEGLDGEEVFKMATATATQEPTNTPTQKPTPEPTPTNTPEPPLFHNGIDLGKETEIEITFPNLLERSESISIVTVPKVYKDNFSEEEVGEYIESIAPGENASQLDTDKYGNTLLIPHSGYFEQTPLEAEAFREYLEGGLKDNPSGERLSDEEVQKRLEALVGTQVLIDQDGTERVFQVDAVGHVPNDQKDRYYQDSKDVLDVIIDNDGGSSSEFGSFRISNGIIMSFCGWGERGDPEWWIDSIYAIGLRPVDSNGNKSIEQKSQTSSSQIDSSEDDTNESKLSSSGSGPEFSTQSILLKNAHMLSEAINTGVDSKLHGTDLSNHIREYIEDSGVEITQELSKGLKEFNNELSDNEPPQCLETNNLYTSLPGIEAVDLYGWEVNYTKDLIADERERLMRGDVINTNGALRFRAHSVSDYEAGDHFVIPQTAVHTNGHVGTVIDRWEENGQTHLLIFDVNFADDGRGRIVNVTEENLYQVLAGLPKGMTTPLFAVRSYPNNN